MLPRPLFYGGTPAEGFGWGVCNKHLIHELSKCGEVMGPWSVGAHVRELVGADVFMPLADHEFNPVSPVRGERNFAYTFFEFGLGPNAAANAANYEVVFCGSTWCLERMRARGISHGKVLVQGVDHELFRPGPEEPRGATNGLRIFSGGKFELRKGQDLVIAAFRKLLKRYPSAKLVCSWHNPWPQVILSMKESPHLAMTYGDFQTQEDFYRALLLQNGIPSANVEVLPSVSHTDLVRWMRATDFGLFPNRCEGGTNLVLMEYLACGRTAVASLATGHADVLTADNALTVPPRWTARFWDEPDVGELVQRMEQLATDPALRAKMGAAAAESMRPWSWARSARTIVETIRGGN